MGMPGCFSSLSNVFGSVLFANVNNVDVATVQVVDNPAILGFKFRTQAALLSQCTNAAGVVVSRGLSGVVGD